MESDYIAELAEELRTMALRGQMPFLAFLLAMVVEEARTERRQPPPAGRA